MKLKDLPKNELPREKLLLNGSENLSNTDLLCILLRTGTKENSVYDIANNILSTLEGINKLSTIGIRELSKIKGVGFVKAETILAAIELGKRVYSRQINLGATLNNSDIVHDTFKCYFKGINQEKFMAIYLDNKKRLISYKTHFIGTIDKSIVDQREVFLEALKVSASSIILIHNHPSGILTPSNEDINFTMKIIESGKMLNIPIIDHIITNGDEYYSFYEN